MKGGSDLPYARAIAESMWGSTYESALAKAQTEQFRQLTAHFVNRYRTVDKLMAAFPTSNVLEIASGLSFRSLDQCLKDPSISYFDTDLEDMIATKLDVLRQIHISTKPEGLRIEALNALSSTDFSKLCSTIPEGGLTVVQEGLLVYLDEKEKAVLAQNIRNELVRRGGQWICGDVYVRRDSEDIFGIMLRSYKSRAFHRKHQIEEKKFESFENAEQFFTDQGFEIVGREFNAMSGDPAAVARIAKHHARETWALRVRS